MKLLPHIRTAIGRSRALLLMVVVILSIPPPRVQAANRPYINFEHIGLAEGLTHTAVTSIAEDSLGVIWLGTRNGLNRYDGSTITAYHARRGHPNWLPENQVKYLKASGSKLWIQTFGALSCYDIIDETFRNYNVPGIKSFEVGTRVWVGTTDGLYILDRENGGLEKVDTGLPVDCEYSALLEIPSRGMVLGTTSGVFFLEHSGVIHELVPDVAVTRLFMDSKSNVWSGSMSDGAFRISPDGTVRRYTDKVLSHNFVRCIEEDRQGRIWFGTLLGLDRFDPDTGTVDSYVADDNDPSQLSHSSIWALCCDSNGTFWAGTYFGGVNVFNPDKNTFRYFPPNSSGNTGPGFRIVGAMCEEGNQGLWICTEGGGLNYYDRTSGTFTYYSHNPADPSTISCNNARGVVSQGDSILWVSTHTGGLNRFDKRTGKFRSLQHLPSHSENIRSSNIGEIIRFQDKYILATHNGVMLFDPMTEEVARFLPQQFHNLVSHNIFAVMFDGQNLWIGTEMNGLARYDVTTGEFSQYTFDVTNLSGIGSDLVNSIYQDRFGRIWIATSNGLDLYRPATDDFEHFSVADGLPGNMVLNLTDSRYEDLLITTNAGLSIFSYAGRRFNNYTSQNGLQLTEINANSLLVCSSGEVFLGGVNGMVSFFESDLLQTRERSGIAVTGLSVNNRPVLASDGSGIINRNIMMCDRIDLRPGHTVFSLTFSDVGMTGNRLRRLSYKLDGFDPDWIAADGTNSASYTNLPPGTYTFRVKDALEPEASAGQVSLTVAVHPPFYRTGWAFLLYGLLILAIILFLNRMYLLRRRAEYELTLKESERLQEAEYNQSKLRFFTNVSHEFRTPLTLISGQLEYLLESRLIPPAVYNRILGAYKNTRRMQSMINEFLDFRRQENGHNQVQASEGDFREFLYAIFVSYMELASNNSIDYKFDAVEEPVSLWFDPQLMEKVFYNILSNAFKFTPVRGAITLSLDDGDGNIVVRVSDTGSGIPSGSLDKIFDRFYQAGNVHEDAPHAQQGTGVGLSLARYIVEAHGGTIGVESSPGCGAVFTVTLPKGCAHLSEDQKVDRPAGTPVIVDDIRDFGTKEATLSPPAARGHTVLVVEDNREMLEFLRESLSETFLVETAADGEQGLARAREIQPSLVLSDVMMPRMSGTELCARLKGDIETSHIPVVLLTARTATDHKIEGLQTGADDYITKPFSIKLLIARIGNIIDNRLAMKRRFSSDPDAEAAQLGLNELDAAFMARARECITRNIDNPDYSVGEFASDMCMGRTSLFSKVKGVTGQTPNDLMLSIRLKEAVNIMYRDPAATVSEVAYKCGFSSQQYFSTCFRRFYGMPPGQYLQKKISERK